MGIGTLKGPSRLRGSNAAQPPVTASITASNQADAIALVSLAVTASGGQGTFTYSWTLTDPTGTAQNGLLSSTSTASVTYTPSLIGGTWVAICSVSDGSETVTVTHVHTLGNNGWVQIFEYESDGASNITPVAGALPFGGKSWGTINEANDTATGPKIAAGRLTISPTNGTDLSRGAPGTRTAPGLTMPLTTLNASLTMLGAKQLMWLIDDITWAPGATNEAIRFGIEQASNGFGTGSSGRGVAGGLAYNGTLRAGSVVRQDSSGTGNLESTATLASVGSVAVLMANSAVRIYSSATVGAFAKPAEVLAGSPALVGGVLASGTVPTLDRLVMAATSPDAGAGPAFSCGEMSIWVR